MEERITDSLHHAAVFALAACAVWLSFSTMGRDLLIFLALAAAVIFALYYICGRIGEKRSPRERILIGMLPTAVALWVLVYLILSALAYSAIFFPHFDENAYDTLADHVLPGEYEEFVIGEGESRISGWHIGEKAENRPLIIYFGGNAENSASRVREILLTAGEYDALDGCGFVMADMPGYGKSAGYPSERRIRDLALRVYDGAVQNYRPSKVIIMGYSIGTGAANYLASQRQTDGLVLYAPYADGYDLYNSRLNIFYGPMRLCVAYKMEAYRFAQDIRVKPLIAMSVTDEVIPPASTRRLCECYQETPDIIVKNDLRHAYFWNDSEVQTATREYISEVISREA